MNILLLNWRTPGDPEYGGSELYWEEMGSRWTKQGHNIFWIGRRYEGCKNTEIIKGMEIIRLGNKLTLYLLTPFTYFKLSKKVDIIIDCENGIPFFSPLWSTKPKFLHIHHIHGFKEVNIWKIESEGKGIKMWLLGIIGQFLEMKLMPLIYRKTPIITLSESSKSEISEAKLGKVIGVVNPGITFYNYKKYQKEKIPTILFLNRIKKYKGIKVLLDAIFRLEIPLSYNFWIVGEGDDLTEMTEYAKKLGLQNTTFFGKVSEEKKQELIQKAWIFVNPSFKEGWSIVNIEANYFGLPVIGSNVSGIKDSVIDGKTGLLFEYGNYKELAEKIEYLIENKKIREKMSKEARKWAKNFSWELSSNKYLKIIENE